MVVVVVCGGEVVVVVAMVVVVVVEGWEGSSVVGGAFLGASDVSGVWPGRRVWVANEICPLTATDLPAVVTTGRG